MYWVCASKHTLRYALYLPVYVYMCMYLTKSPKLIQQLNRVFSAMNASVI